MKNRLKKRNRLTIKQKLNKFLTKEVNLMTGYQKLKEKLDKANKKIEEQDKVWTIYYKALVTIANFKGTKVVEAPAIASNAIEKGLGIQLAYQYEEK